MITDCRGACLLRCHRAYDFAAATLTQHLPPCPIAGNGITYSCVIPKTYTVCKATSVKPLSDQKVTLTVLGAHWQPTTTTEVGWDYENDFIVATPAMISQRLYTDPVAGTTSTCFGRWWNCEESNPFIPRPTFAPYLRDQYIPRPSPAVNQTMPASSYPSTANVWPVPGTCPAHSGNNTERFSPL
jgi:hypothetical protein